MLREKLSGKEQEIYFYLESKEMNSFRTKDVLKLTAGNRNYLYTILSRMCSKGWIRRIKKGTYERVPSFAIYPKGEYKEEPILLVPKLFKKYYVGFYSAVELKGLANQVTYTVYVVTTVRKKPIEYGGFKIQPVTVKKKFFTGYEEMTIKYETIFVSDLEKTLADCFYMPRYAIGLPEILRVTAESSEKIDWKKFQKYLLVYNKKFLYQKVGYCLELLKKTGIRVPSWLIHWLEKKTSKSIFRLERGRKGGTWNKKWNITDNIGRERLLRW